MYLLDTNVISELRQGKPHQSAAVRVWAAGVPAGQLYLSAISILELEKGVMLLERRTPPQGSALRAWLGATVRAFDRAVHEGATPLVTGWDGVRSLAAVEAVQVSLSSGCSAAVQLVG